MPETMAISTQYRWAADLNDRSPSAVTAYGDMTGPLTERNWCSHRIEVAIGRFGESPQTVLSASHVRSPGSVRMPFPRPSQGLRTGSPTTNTAWIAISGVCRYQWARTVPHRVLAPRRSSCRGPLNWTEVRRRLPTARGSSSLLSVPVTKASGSQISTVGGPCRLLHFKGIRPARRAGRRQVPESPLRRRPPATQTSSSSAHRAYRDQCL